MQINCYVCDDVIEEFRRENVYLGKLAASCQLKDEDLLRIGIPSIVTKEKDKLCISNQRCILISHEDSISLWKAQETRKTANNNIKSTFKIISKQRYARKESSNLPLNLFQDITEESRPKRQ